MTLIDHANEVIASVRRKTDRVILFLLLRQGQRGAARSYGAALQRDRLRVHVFRQGSRPYRQLPAGNQSPLFERAHHASAALEFVEGLTNRILLCRQSECQNHVVERY